MNFSIVSFSSSLFYFAHFNVLIKFVLSIGRERTKKRHLRKENKVEKIIVLMQLMIDPRDYEGSTLSFFTFSKKGKSFRSF